MTFVYVKHWLIGFPKGERSLRMKGPFSSLTLIKTRPPSFFSREFPWQSRLRLRLSVKGKSDPREHAIRTGVVVSLGVFVQENERSLS
ncbi:Uncharacterized protein DAT39_011314 [Clarias magur]|uniref:Uncharacterized protein n=1 Tax=Clarias magur TaxID=1594786 RepID=A0A8J4UMK7_CLAMG|nr:Uncharacterized protein DAT39_011314 [Clarias magur]